MKKISKSTKIIILINIVFVLLLILYKNIAKSKYTHNFLLNVVKNVEMTNFLEDNSDKKVYMAIYDDKQVFKYESDYHADLNSCLSEIEDKIGSTFKDKKIRIDIINKGNDIDNQDNLINLLNNPATLSYYYEDGRFYKLDSYEIGKARDINDINMKNDVLISTYNYMLNQIKEDGTFEYSINLITGDVSNSYNVVRHCGSLWGLLETYKKFYKGSNQEHLDLLKKSYDYIYNNLIVKKSDDTYFIFTDKVTTRIGGNCLYILASLELYDITGDNKYLDIAIKTANGILYTQDIDGSFYHIIDENYNKTGKESSEIYSGEILLSLIRMYGKTKNELYLNSTLKSMDYYIKENNVNTDNQWYSYFYNELLKYTKDYKYFKYYIDKMEENLTGIDDIISRCDMEYLGNSYLFLNELIENYDEYHFDKYISKKQLNELLNHLKKTYINRAQKGLSNYSTIENSMYFKDINLYLGSFFEENYEARIDVSQHNLSGFRLFYETMYVNDKLNDARTDVGVYYLELAKKAVETYVTTGNVITVPDNLPAEVYENCKNGVYVGIHNKKKVRGCRGSFYPQGSNGEEVIEYAIAAATDDERYSPVDESEFDDLIYEVSILTEPIEVTDISELDVKKYGIIIEKEANRATMLPNRDTISTVEEQIKKTLKKAGLSEDEKDYKIYKFETITYKSE